MKHSNERGALGVAGIVAIAVVAALVVGGVSFYDKLNSLRSESIPMENGLNAQYLDNQNELSQYTSGFYEQLGIVQYKSEQLDQILMDYAKGRNFGKNGESQGAAFINAVMEAVPDLKGLDIADRMMDYVQAGRARYGSKQTKLLDMIRGYNDWRQDGIVQSWIIEKWLGIPSHRLEARIGTQVLYGQDALEKMKQIVITSQTKQAYETGVMEPLQMPQTQKAAPQEKAPAPSPAPAKKPAAKKTVKAPAVK